MRRIVSLVLALLCLALPLCSMVGCETPKASKTKYTDYSFDYFNTVTTIIGYEETQEEFAKTLVVIKEGLKKYHRLYDIYHTYDGVNNLCTVNRTVGGVHQVVTVEKEIIDLLTYAKEMYTLTDGRVNVAMGAVLSIWHQYRSQGIKNPANATLPPEEALNAAAEHVNIADLIIDEENSTVFLADPKMTLDVGAIAKGYAVEMVAQMMEEAGMTGYILNVGGNVRTIGHHPDGSKWSVGLENPGIDGAGDYISYLKISDLSLVTSGTHQRFYEVDGVPYHHIIDPDTLMPGTRYLSVSILCPHSGYADALSTALFNMPYETGLALIEGLENVEAMWVLKDGTIYTSSGFSQYTYTP